MIETLQRKIENSCLPYKKCGDDTDVHFFAFSYRRLMRLKKSRVLLIQTTDGAFLSATWIPRLNHFRSPEKNHELDSVRRVYELVDPFGLHKVSR